MGKYRSQLDRELDSIRDKFKQEDLEIQNNIEQNSPKIKDEEEWLHTSFMVDEFHEPFKNEEHLLDDSLTPSIEKNLILTKSDYLLEILDKPFRKPNFI